MKRIIAIVIALGFLLLPVTPALATSPTQGAVQGSTQFAICRTGAENFFGIQPWYACLPEDKNGNPKIEALSDVLLIIFPLVEALVKIAVYVAIAYIFLMLFKIMLARGDTGKITQAGHGIRDAIIGLIIALVAISIVNFIAFAIQGS